MKCSVGSNIGTLLRETASKGAVFFVFLVKFFILYNTGGERRGVVQDVDDCRARGIQAVFIV